MDGSTVETAVAAIFGTPLGRFLASAVAGTLVGGYQIVRALRRNPAEIVGDTDGMRMLPVVAGVGGTAIGFSEAVTNFIHQPLLAGLVEVMGGFELGLGLTYVVGHYISDARTLAHYDSEG